MLVQVNNPRTFPVAGTDGKFHVAYNLLLQNASQVPATIRKLEVVDATSTSKVLATFSGSNWWTLLATSVTATVFAPFPPRQYRTR